MSLRLHGRCARQTLRRIPGRVTLVEPIHLARYLIGADFFERLSARGKRERKHEKKRAVLGLFSQEL